MSYGTRVESENYERNSQAVLVNIDQRFAHWKEVGHPDKVKTRSFEL